MYEMLPIVKSLWRNKTGPLLIIIQLSLTIAIISNALFFINQRIKIIDRPTGIAENEIIRVWMKANSPNADIETILQRDLKIIRAMDGVLDAAAIDSIPISGGGSASSFKIAPGEQEETKKINANTYKMDDHGVNTLGMKLLAGRNFYPDEIIFRERNSNPNSVHAIVTQQFAEKMFPNEEVVGKTFYFSNDTPVRVIGVVESMLGAWPKWHAAGNVVFTPGGEQNDAINYLIRTAEADRETLMLKIIEKMREIDATRLLLDEKTMESIKRQTYSGDHAMIRILSVVISMLVLVNALGIIGLTTFWVNQRRKQVGIRRALGATKMAISRYFLLENVLLCLMAFIVGSALAFVASDYMVRQYSADLLDWPFVPITGISVLIVAMVAASIPAWRASQIPPAEATASV